VPRSASPAVENQQVFSEGLETGENENRVTERKPKQKGDDPDVSVKITETEGTVYEQSVAEFGHKDTHTRNVARISYETDNKEQLILNYTENQDGPSVKSKPITLSLQDPVPKKSKRKEKKSEKKDSLPSISPASLPSITNELPTIGGAAGGGFGTNN